MAVEVKNSSIEWYDRTESTPQQIRRQRAAGITFVVLGALCMVGMGVSIYLNVQGSLALGGRQVLMGSGGCLLASIPAALLAGHFLKRASRQSDKLKLPQEFNFEISRKMYGEAWLENLEEGNWGPLVRAGHFSEADVKTWRLLGQRFRAIKNDMSGEHRFESLDFLKKEIEQFQIQELDMRKKLSGQEDLGDDKAINAQELKKIRGELVQEYIKDFIPK